MKFKEVTKSVGKCSIVLFSFLLAFSYFNSRASGIYNMLELGADNQGKNLNTQIIASTIASASEIGGGTLYFPAGTYLTGPIHLKSNIVLNLEAGATLLFSDHFDHYLPFVASRWEGTNVNNFSPLIYAYEAENITITGRGKIDGQGKKWWESFFDIWKNHKEDKTKWQLEFEKQNPDILRPDLPGMIELGFLRPPFIQFMYCSNIKIEGITIVNSPFWTVNPQFCDHLTVDGVTINNPPSPNTDGINPESCRNVHISNCHISVGDDCITIKSGKDRDGRLRNVPCENITISNCTMLNGHGGVVIGSEMSGGVKKVTITNCVFQGTDRGIRIKSARGRGGVVEDIRVSNIILKDLKREAFTLNLFYQKSDPEPFSERTPVFRNIHYSNVTGTAKQSALIVGLEESPVENISFNDIRLSTQTGFQVKDARDISFHQVHINTQSGPAIKAEKVKYLDLCDVRTNEPHENDPVIELINVQHAYVRDCYQNRPTKLFMKIDGENSHDINLRNNLFQWVKTPVQQTGNVPKVAVTFK